ncbi:MAG: cupin domain-containing protein, partial [Desulfobacteraceae bacterium]
MQHVSIDDLKEFATDKRIRKKLASSEKIVAEMVCYTPGQVTPNHMHPKQDEIFYVVEGKGTMIVDDEEIPVGPKSVIFVPERVSHGVKAAEDSNL